MLSVPVEFVVRGYITGSTDPCGQFMTTGLGIIVARHFLKILQLGLMTKDGLDEVSNKALALFGYGQQVASDNGLILVDTKYEFGKADDGAIMLVDEAHTPDSSRYWIVNSHEERFNAGLEPENVDKIVVQRTLQSI